MLARLHSVMGRWVVLAVSTVFMALALYNIETSPLSTLAGQRGAQVRNKRNK